MTMSGTAPGKYGPVEMFRTGTFTPMQGEAMTFSAADLAAVADSYDAAKSPAPVVVGHPATDAPAYGWVDRMDFDRNSGRLNGTLRDVDPAFATAVREGRYKKVSAAFFLPDSAANPVPGTLYLRHLGFLGGAAPAVTGLKPVSFSAEANTVEFASDFDARDLAAQEAADTIAALRDEIAALKQELDALKPAEKQAESPEFAAMRSEVAAIRREKPDHELEKLIDQGRLLPVLKAEVLEFATGLDMVDTVSFSGDVEATQRDWFMGYLAKQPKVVSFGAMDLGDDPFSTGPTTRQGGNIPDGYFADRSQDALLASARRIVQDKGVSFSDALDVAMKEAR